jgi:8-oxo-dGTP diphosphatase
MNKIDKFLGSVIFTPAVVGYLIKGDKVCLGIRKKVSLGLGENLIAGIGGKVGDTIEIKNETVSMAIDRELNEEVGIRVIKKQEMGRVRFIYFHKPKDSKWNQDVRIYSVTKWKGEPTETESIKPVWFDINNIPWKLMWADNIYWLPKVLSGKKINAIFIFSNDQEIMDYRFDEVV